MNKIEKHKELRSQNLRLTLVLAILFFVLVSLFNYYRESDAQTIKLCFFDVGQGDMEMIQTPGNKRIIIDGGPNESAISKIDKVVPFYDRKIDAIILTHPHADHLVGLISLLKNYEVKSLYFTGVTHNTSEYLEFLKLVKEKNIEVHVVKSGDYIELDNNIRLSFLFPMKDISDEKTDNLNDTSIVARLTWGEESALFMGDLESDGQDELLESGKYVNSDLIKIAHHGSNDSANQKFIDAVSPEIALISVGRDNKFGHPSQILLNLLNNVKIYRTDQDGDMEFDMSQSEIKHKTK
jgi:competence protein ComEC